MIHNNSTRRPVGFLMIMTLLFVTLSPAGAAAGIVGTSTVIAEESAMMDRDVLIEQLNRENVRGQLEQMGVNVGDAVERVAAMTDSEVRELAAGLEAYPAGGDVGVGLGVILLVILIILLLR